MFLEHANDRLFGRRPPLIDFDVIFLHKVRSKHSQWATWFHLAAISGAHHPFVCLVSIHVFILSSLHSSIYRSIYPSLIYKSFQMLLFFLLYLFIHTSLPSFIFPLINVSFYPWSGHIAPSLWSFWLIVCFYRLLVTIVPVRMPKLKYIRTQSNALNWEFGKMLGSSTKLSKPKCVTYTPNSWPPNQGWYLPSFFDHRYWTWKI